MSKSIEKEIKKYNFYHKIKISDNIYTREDDNEHYSHRKIFSELDKIDFNGKKVLDIGCRDGIFCFYAEKRGAKEIIGIDNNLSKGAIEFLIPHFKSKVKMFEMNIYDLTEADFGKFDIILFFGVLYHLREPITSLKKCYELLNDNSFLILETSIIENIESKPLIYIPVEESPYDPTSCTFFNIKGIFKTLESLNFDVLSYKAFTLRKFSYLKKVIKNIFWLLFNIQKIGKFDLIILNRALFITKKKITIKNSLSDYWYSKHKIHQK